MLAQIFSRLNLRLAPGPQSRVVRRAVTLSPSGGVRVIAEKA